ncbi:hypothetical protein K7X08_016750 [Anisodus acutangulus]|uniref:LIM zinc-binding domain-containing protein n=1 Tax=Anisodus acutangulus TaxID=402998 RepID=A0A9Q1LT89_9SOLA|nr:hypothetical protein K7X08_016750 [Anisodus acutangulus]
MFSGTLDKCAACNKTVYPLEKVTMEGEAFHRSCFKCAHGGCSLTHATYAALDGVLYCKNHFAQLFMEKGNYQHVLKAANNKKSSVAPVDDDETQEPAHDKPDDSEQPDKKEPDEDGDKQPQEES